MSIQGQDSGQGNRPVLYITASSTGNVDVSFSTRTRRRIPRLPISEASASPSFIPSSFRSVGTGIGNNGIRVTATGLVNVFAVNSVSSSTDGCLVLPEDSLGTEYYVISSAPVSTDQNSQVLVVATEDSTRVTFAVHPDFSSTVNVFGRTYLRGEIFEVELQALETFQLQSNADLSGMHVVSNKRVAVFSGSDGATLSPDTPSSGVGHLVEQLPPVSALGTRFSAKSFPSSGGQSHVKVLTTEPDTIEVRYADDTRDTFTTSRRGATQKIYFFATDDLFFISTEYPALVVHFSVHSDGDQDSTMVLLPPMAQYSSAYYVTTPGMFFGLGFNNYAVITIQENRRSTLRIDGGRLSNPQWVFVTAPDGGRMAAVAVPFSSGNTNRVRIYTVSSSVRFGVVLFGVTPQESYGFPAGMSVASINPRVSETFRC